MIKEELQANFKVLPVTVIPQTGRQGRIILDLSFLVRRPPTKQAGSKQQRTGEVMAESVNDTTAKLAPQGPARKIAQVLPRLFHDTATMPKDHEIRLSTVNLSDGFWRLIVEPSQICNFCCVMPDPPGARVRIVAPSALQMGWAESPACFCAATETGWDTTEFLLQEKVELPAQHPLEKFMKPADTPKTAPPKEERALVSACIDDQVLASVESDGRTLPQRAFQATLRAIHLIFPHPKVSGHVGGKDPISLEKHVQAAN